MAEKLFAGWRQVAACMFLQAVGAATIASAFSVVAVPLSAAFHPSRMVLMFAMTVMSLGSGMMSPFLGSLMDRISLKRLMFIGAAFLVSGYVALSFATSFTQVLLVYALLMAPANVLVGTMAASVLISRWFVKRRGAALGIVMSGIAIGGFVFPPLIQWLIETFAWRDAFRILAAVIFLCMFPTIAMIMNQPSDKGLFPDGALSDPEISLKGSELLSARVLLTDKTFWFIAALLAVVMSGTMGMVTNIMPIAIDQGIAPSSAVLLISIYAACGFCAKLTFAAVSDTFNLRYLMFASLIGFTIGMTFLSQAAGGYWVIATGVGFVGIFAGFIVPLEGLLIAKTYGRTFMGRVAGLLNLFILGALLLTPPAFGLVYDLTGNYKLIFFVFVSLAIGTMFLVPHIRLGPKLSQDGSEVTKNLGAYGKALAEQ